LSVLIQRQAETEKTGNIQPAQAQPLITCLFQHTSALPRNKVCDKYSKIKLRPLGDKTNPPVRRSKSTTAPKSRML
jgi:hypothetical protein